MQTVADLNRIDGASIDFAKLRDLLLQTGMRLILRLRRAFSGTEVEAGQPILAGFHAVGNLVQTILHIGGELVVHILRKLRLQQLDHGESQPGRNQRTTALIHVPAIDDGGDDARICGRATNLLGFKRLDERGFGVSRRRLGFMPVGGDFRRGKLVARLHRRQGSVIIVRFDGLLGGFVGGLVGRSVTSLPCGLHKARELDDRTGSLEHGLTLVSSRCGQTHGGGGTGGIGHLRGKRTLPNQRIQTGLIGRHLLGDFARITELRAGRTNTFVGLLRTGGLGGILLRRI